MKKIVTFEQMRKAEAGLDPALLMERAAIELARFGKPKTLLLVGKGNNGADALAAGTVLLGQGFSVQAICPYEEEESTPLNQLWRRRFLQGGGERVDQIEEADVIFDGFLGTGFKGSLDPKLATWIDRANASAIPIVAIDVPSAFLVQASDTVALGFAKWECFSEAHWEKTGRLHVADIGLNEDAVDGVAFLPGPLKLPKIVRTRHKYQAGFVVGFCGSKKLPGAARLAGLAALRGGAGMVKMFTPQEIGPVAYELICQTFHRRDWQEALKKASSVFIGPGLARCKLPDLSSIAQPCVIDADAIQEKLRLPKQVILTPHRAEMLRLVKSEQELGAFTKKQGAVVLLKGSPTLIYSHGKPPIVIVNGDPGMATAGSGDVLTGLLAALLAQGLGCEEAAILGATLHGMAGEMAAQKLTSYCLIASDLIAYFPQAFKELKSKA